MAMFLPVLEFMENGGDVLGLAEKSQAWKSVIEVLSRTGLELTLSVLLVAAVGTMLMRVIVIYARQVYVAWLTQEMLHETRCRLFDAHIRMAFGDFTRLSSGSIVNLLTTETQRAVGSFAALFALVANLTVCIGFIAVLLWLSVPLTLMAVVFLGGAGAIAAYYVRHTRQHSHAATKANDKYSRMMLERLNGFRIIKLSSSARREINKTREASLAVRDKMFWLSRVVASIDLILEPLVLIAGGVILYAAVQEFGMTLAEVGIFVVVLLRLLPIAKEIMKSRQTFNSCVGSLSAVISGHRNAILAMEESQGVLNFEGVRKQIRFDKVSFRFPDADRLAIDAASFVVPAGKVTALVGPSGAGKTTLIDLLARVQLPQSGSIAVDGTDIGNFDLAKFREAMAIVSQDAFIFDDTIAANLRFVKPHASEADLWKALEKAQASEFVAATEQGLETLLGERGARLSGGQKQRLSLARAFLQDADILILDEPTSALDSETEGLIQQAIDNLRAEGNVTLIVIAHRLSTIREADQIIVLQDGRVVEHGSHEELVMSETWYSRVSGLQTGQVSTLAMGKQRLESDL